MIALKAAISYNLASMKKLLVLSLVSGSLYYWYMNSMYTAAMEATQPMRSLYSQVESGEFYLSAQQ